MKTRYSTAITVVLLSLAAILFTGCKKSHWGFRSRPGEEIVFKIRSNTGSDTRTVYNDNNGEYFTVGETKYEGLDWVDGDAMTLAYVFVDGGLGVDLADYSIVEGSVTPSSVSDGRVVSLGTLKSVKPNGLQWHDGDVHQFYANYPEVDYDDPNFVFEVENGQMNAKVPYYYPMVLDSANEDDMTKDGRVWVENMKYAYMNSLDSHAAPLADGTVQLTVGPHFTAFEIEVRAQGEDTIPLKSFTLSSSYSTDDVEDGLIGGTFFLNYHNDDGDWWNEHLEGEGNTSNSVTLDFSNETEYADGGILLTNDNPIKFTIFTRGGYVHYKLTIGFDIINGAGERVNRSLKLAHAYDITDELSDNQIPWIWFYGNRKHRISGLELPLNVSKLSLWYEGQTYAGGYINDDWND